MSTASRVSHSVFVAHAAEDLPFVRPLLRLFSVQGMAAWHDPDDSVRDDGSPAAAEKGLLETESLVLVLSPAALRSAIVRAQVRAFRQNQPQGPVLVLVLEPVVPDHPLLGDLSGATNVDASVSRLDGMRHLVDTLRRIQMADSQHGVLALANTVSTPELTQALLREVAILSMRNRQIRLHQPLPSLERQQLLVEIIGTFHDVLARKFRLVNPVDGDVTDVPEGVLEELVMDSQIDSDGLLTWVPEFFARAVAGLLAEAFRIEPVRPDPARRSSHTLAPPPSVQAAQVEALRKFSTLASRIKSTPAAV